MLIVELIHAPKPDFEEGLCLLVTEPTQALPGLVVIHNNRTNRMASAGDEEGLCILVTEPTQSLTGLVVVHNNRTNLMACAGDESFMLWVHHHKGCWFILAAGR